MNTVPRLTIGLPVRNGGRYLPASLDSLLNQTYTDFELIISDNASTDDTAAICRRYARRDSRIRYLRQKHNIGAAPNHNVVVRAGRGELFKWAGHDDLYEPSLLARCVQALDADADSVLAWCQSALIDEDGAVRTEVAAYPASTDSPLPHERFAHVLFDRGGDDDYGIIRMDLLRRTAMSGSHYHADRTLVAELALHGRFRRIPVVLYYRRDLPDRAGSPKRGVRDWCVTHDPRRASRFRHPTVRLLGEYVWGFVTAIRRASLTPVQRWRCHRVLTGYLLDRMRTAVSRGRPLQSGGVRRSGIRSDAGMRDGTDPVVTRVGLFGLFGSGNLGNDGSLEVLLRYLRAEYPDAVLNVRCSGPDDVSRRYGVPTSRLHWYDGNREVSAARAVALKLFGKLLDPVRVLCWVRKQDVVIVPGMGVLEATLPIRPWGYPYALFSLCACGRFTGTRVMLVGVGADLITERGTRRVLTAAAKLAPYRSYRDDRSRAALRKMGVDTTADEVYSDLVFALPIPRDTPARAGTVGVGVMSYRGAYGDHREAAEIYRAYRDAVRQFVRWLVDQGREVTLFIGDEADEAAVRDVLADLRPTHDLRSAPVRAVAVSDLHELMRHLVDVDTVVATRYHNLVCALKLGKPTLSIGYARKNDALMSSMGLAEFCQSARAVDVDRLITQFRSLEANRTRVTATIRARERVNRGLLDEQFAVLSAKLCGTIHTTHSR